MYEVKTKLLFQLADDLAEKRNDISEILYDILCRETYSPDNLEHRYIYGDVPVENVNTKTGTIEICYDTLTTLIEYHNKNNGYSVAENLRYVDEDYEYDV